MHFHDTIHRALSDLVDTTTAQVKLIAKAEKGETSATKNITLARTVSGGITTILIKNCASDPESGAPQEVAGRAARLALTGIAENSVIYQIDNETFWQLSDIAQSGTDAGWTLLTSVILVADENARFNLGYLPEGVIVQQTGDDPDTYWVLIDSANSDIGAGWSQLGG